ncbi:MAG: hypothetical protein IIT67_03890, partial [Clostridia bacterium]|nr:hypothetical protein [Clostridia bacterium]
GMKLMVVGGGGREHAIIKKLNENKDVEVIYALPGNGGMADDAVCTGIGATDIPAIVKFGKENAIDIYLSEDYEDVIGDGKWEALFTEQPAPFLRKDQRAYLATVTGVSIGSDAFFPFSDNIERAYKSGVSYVAQPGGSVRDDLVIQACDDMGMVMAFTGLRLFHH